MISFPVVTILPDCFSVNHDLSGLFSDTEATTSFSNDAIAIDSSDQTITITNPSDGFVGVLNFYFMAGSNDNFDTVGGSVPFEVTFTDQCSPNNIVKWNSLSIIEYEQGPSTNG